MLLTVILIVSTLLLGYLWGKHDGRAEGYQRGTVDIPLLLREQSLEQGYCVLCNEQKQAHDVFSDDVIPLFDALAVEHLPAHDTSAPMG